MATVDCRHRDAAWRGRTHQIRRAVYLLLACATLQSKGATAEAEVIQVADADSLQAAISSGVPHIEIVQHLDLEGLPAANDTDASSATLQPAPGLRSITVSLLSCIPSAAARSPLWDLLLAHTSLRYARVRAARRMPGHVCSAPTPVRNACGRDPSGPLRRSPPGVHWAPKAREVLFRAARAVDIPNKAAFGERAHSCVLRIVCKAGRAQSCVIRAVHCLGR